MFLKRRFAHTKPRVLRDYGSIEPTFVFHSSPALFHFIFYSFSFRLIVVVRVKFSDPFRRIKPICLGSSFVLRNPSENYIGSVDLQQDFALYLCRKTNSI